MPTTFQEATEIITISQEYLPLDEMKELFVRLDDEVGVKTENESLKQSLRMMRQLVESAAAGRKLEEAPRWVYPAFVLLVAFHMYVVIGMVVSFFVIPFTERMTTALPLMAFIWFFSTTRVECKLTEMENKLRQQLGMRRIGGFVGHYFVKPVKRRFFPRKLS